MNYRCRTTMLDRTRPNHILKSATSGVYIQSVFVQYLGGQQIVMRFLDEGMLYSLKSVGLSARDAFPTGSEWGCAVLQVLKIGQPGKSRLCDKTSRHTHLARHLIRAVRNAAGIAGARRNRARSASTGFILCRKLSQCIGQ